VKATDENIARNFSALATSASLCLCVQRCALFDVDFWITINWCDELLRDVDAMHGSFLPGFGLPAGSMSAFCRCAYLQVSCLSPNLVLAVDIQTLWSVNSLGIGFRANSSLLMHHLAQLCITAHIHHCT
jgi:hypothetical protein